MNADQQDDFLTHLEIEQIRILQELISQNLDKMIEVTNKDGLPSDYESLFYALYSIEISRRLCQKENNNATILLHENIINALDKHHDLDADHDYSLVKKWRKYLDSFS